LHFTAREKQTVILVLLPSGVFMEAFVKEGIDGADFAGHMACSF
jgi:hypothetical protein